MNTFNPFDRERLDGPPEERLESGVDADGFRFTAIDAETGDPSSQLAPEAAQEEVSRIVTQILRRTMEAHDERPVEHFLMDLPPGEIEDLDPELLLAANELSITCLAKALRQALIDFTGTDAMLVRRDRWGRVNLITGDHLPNSLELSPGDPANA
jgi:hypothetical protein